MGSCTLVFSARPQLDTEKNALMQHMGGWRDRAARGAACRKTNEQQGKQ